MPDVTPAEEMRSAERLMRERATAASEGPWKSWVEGRDHRGGDSMIGTPDENGGDIHVRVGRGRHLKWEADQDYIASMHPLVGLALADLLDRAAKEAGKCLYLDRPLDGAIPGWLCSACDGMADFDCHLDGALKLARLYLGGVTA